MFVVFVNAHVKPEYIDAFIKVSFDNASNSVKEPGVIRFDVYQQADDPSRFTLLEVYRTEDDPVKHRETAHYLRWRDAAAYMLVEPRTRTTNNIIFPPPSDW